MLKVQPAARLCRLAALIAVLLPLTPAWAEPPPTTTRTKKAADAPHYLTPDAVDWQAVLDPGPPLAGSKAADADLAAVRRWQRERTPADVERCKREDKLSPWLFADVLGPGFDHAHCPATDRLLRRAEVDSLYFADSAKQRWERPRPPKVDPGVHPVVGKQMTGSYPSSHAARGVVWAAILAQLYPDHADALRAEGKRIGDDRVVAGIHFPTDVDAGQKLGEGIAKQLLSNRGFEADLAKAKAEVAAVNAARPTTAP